MTEKFGGRVGGGGGVGTEPPRTSKFKNIIIVIATIQHCYYRLTISLPRYMTPVFNTRPSECSANFKGRGGRRLRG